MVGGFNNIVSDTVGFLDVLLWGQMLENEMEVEATLGSDFASRITEHIGH